MMRIFSSLICAVVISVNISNAQTSSVEPDPDAFLEAINAFENKDFQMAVELFTVLAEQGEPTSQHNLAILYFKGLGSPLNYKRALYWAWRAALGGSERAIVLVDDIRELVTDELIEIVAEEIVVELAAKAMAGDRNAPERLGKTYYNLFVEPNLQMAYIWLLISQAFGNEAVNSMILEIEGLVEVTDRINYQEEALQKFSKISK